MSTCIIETKNLHYDYGKRQILKDVSLAVPAGSVFGFLGPNGSGKTTTIRLLLGINKAPCQQIHLFGQDIAKHKVDISKRVGALVETPALYPHLSGRDNMEITRIARAARHDDVEQALSLVAMTADATRKVKHYSLGMRQRLGIAMALVGNPDLLVLDEPTNGLDPAGAYQIRALLTDLSKSHGKTIFVSSHLLSEMEKMLTHVAILHEGKLLYQGGIAELRGPLAENGHQSESLEDIFLNLTRK